MNRGKLIAKGRTAEVFEYEEDKILKLFKEDLPKNIIEKEYKASSKVSKKLDLVPKVYDLVKVEDRSGIIYEKVNGTTMMEIIGSKPWMIRREAQRLAELHEAIQQPVDFELPSLKATLKDNISRTELLKEEVKEKLYSYIDELEDDNILCHGDLHPDNILITQDGEAIIDWMTAAKGSRIGDIARTAVMLKFGSDKGKKNVHVVKFLKRRFYVDYIKHYMKISGIKREQIERWELPVAAARLSERLSEGEKKDLLEFIDAKL
ncbi:phosphotransferase family protein [Clostridium felsineum]|uniref:Uncharacterized protein n=1 Tax=Clostridium felsineum TaxID=36839 RepID=A0A1S8L343_9CLOT|nr:aminoglycoside phosphotransferase family protein [Clostridium felsineum]URZ04267.1 hypothetical protein CLAUR_043560 [Clostridium felsineum]URZ07514.1 hypothetical protein CLROS_028520 [Clostridium felsineum]URZ12545.1 hypothetical protein CROST_032670 [Clostridium felsineum]